MKTKKLLAALLLLVVAFSANVMMATTPMAKNSPNAKNVKQKPLISKLPKKGKIINESYNETLGYKDLELSNGVHVLIKPIDSVQDGILLRAMQRGGKSLYGMEDWANCEMYNYVFGDYRMGNWDTPSDNEQVKFFQSMDMDVDYVNGSASAKDLETLFQLTYQRFTGSIARDEDRFNMVLNNYGATLREESLEDHDATGVFLDSIGSVLYDHNWRYKSLKAEDLAQVNYDRILEIAKERTANAAGYTFVFTGAFKESTIRPLIERYIASLPANKSVKSNWTNVTTYPQKETICHFTSKMDTPLTSINIRWINTQMPYNDENEIKARFLSDILKKSQRAMMPEEAGATHPVGGNHGYRFEGGQPFTEIHCFVTVKPEYADQVVRMLKEEMLRACGHIDSESLESLKKGELERIERREKASAENDNWSRIYSESSAITEYAFYGTYFNMTDYKQMLNNITPESISAFARQLLSTGNMIEIVMSPAE